ncbi:hypothetical protein B0T16DRAFT_398713 [Cercophora newfieldiana]|uniref:Uncharacterized protein n=1 Tax=Cercophora newfieldiana TaxID=92897 RepID=A0AA40CZE4_9PEZI|nr:hypothetical protein B0T16DRAFT_398713 [Cercophora newfieldiana]
MPPIRKEEGSAASRVLAGGVEKKRKGPKPKPLSEKVEGWTWDKPKARKERSYTRDRKIEVIMYLVKHKIKEVRSYRRVARRRIGQYPGDGDLEPEMGPDGQMIWHRAPTYAEASEFWKIPTATISNWWEHREKILKGTGIELPARPPPPPEGEDGPQPAPIPPKPKLPPKTPEEIARLREEQKQWLAVRGYGPIMRANPQPATQPKEAVPDGEPAPSARVVVAPRKSVPHIRPPPICTHPVPIRPAMSSAQRHPHPLQHIADPPPPQAAPPPPAPQAAAHPPPPVLGQAQTPSAAPTPVPAPTQEALKPPFLHHVLWVGQVPPAGLFLQHPAVAAGLPPASAGDPIPWVVLYYGPPPGTPGGFPLPDAPAHPNGQSQNGQPSTGPPTNGQPSYSQPPHYPTTPPQQQLPPRQHLVSQQQRPVLAPRPPQPPPANTPLQPAPKRHPPQHPTNREPFPGAVAFSTPINNNVHSSAAKPPGYPNQPTWRAYNGKPPAPQPLQGVQAVADVPQPSGVAVPGNTPPEQPGSVDTALPHEEPAMKDDTPSEEQDQTGETPPDDEIPAAQEAEGEEMKADATAESTPYATPDSGRAGDQDEEMGDAETPESEED